MLFNSRRSSASRFRRLKRESLIAAAPIVLVILAGMLLVGSSAVGLTGLGASGPLQSSPIALTDDGHFLVNANPDNDSVTVFKANTPSLQKLSEIAVGHEPASVALQRDNRTAFVANAADGTVSVVDITTQKSTSSITVGAEPSAVVLSPNGNHLYVANSASNNLMVINAATRATEATIDLSSFGAGPRAIAVTNDGDTDDTDETVFVALFFGQLRAGKTFVDEGLDDEREGRVIAISTATNTPIAAPNPITLEPLTDTGFNSNGRLAPAVGIVPAIPSTNPQTFPTPTGAYPNQLAAIAIHPFLSKAYVVSTGASPNGPLRFNSMAQGLVSVYDTLTHLEFTAPQTGNGFRAQAPLNMNQGIDLDTALIPKLFVTNPVALAWRPNGTDGWVIQNSDVVVRLTVDNAGVPRIGAPLAVGPGTIVRVDLEAIKGDQIAGKAPRGIVINSSGERAYVSNFISRSVTTIDISNPTAPVIAGTNRSADLPKKNTADATTLLGAELFYTGRGPDGRMSALSWGGCVTCHPNGRSDNVTWMFEAGPRQTIPLDGMFDKNNPHDQRPLNWSAVRDEDADFEQNTRGVFGGRGLIDDDRLFFAIGGASGQVPSDVAILEQFQQVTGAVTTKNDLAPRKTLPSLINSLFSFDFERLMSLSDSSQETSVSSEAGGYDSSSAAALVSPGSLARHDFAVATLADDRVFIIGGRSGTGQGTLVSTATAILEFNPRTNTLTKKNAQGFTLRHSLGAAAVRTSQGFRIYAAGGYASTAANSLPVNTVEEYNPDTDTWRTVASLPTAVAQFGITVGGGINTAEPLPLIHVVLGNTGSESAPSVANPTQVQRFQADPLSTGVWSTFNPGLTLRRNLGAAAILRIVSGRVFVIGGQDGAGNVLTTVEEYAAQAGTLVATPHTDIPVHGRNLELPAH